MEVDPGLVQQVSSIIREGKRQRFCQQCGRFHDVTSFDGDKRSCRARLQRHNARRRKKTADSDTPNASKAPPVKRQSSLSRNTREFMRSDSSKKQQTSDSASVSPILSGSIAHVWCYDHNQPTACSVLHRKYDSSSSGGLSQMPFTHWLAEVRHGRHY